MRFLLLVLAVANLTVGTDAVAESPPRLNVVFILADDLGWGELGCYGQEKIPTPHIDRLARQGMRFTQHYSGAPVCAPARCTLMTGRHLGHAEIRGNLQAQVNFPQYDEGQHPISAQAVTLAELFRDAGYVTGAMGKWGLGPVGSTGDPNSQGFDLFFGYNCQAVAHSFYPGYLWRNRDKITINRRPVPGHQRQPKGEVRLHDWIGETYAPRLLVAEAERFIASHKSEPFFLYLPFTEPHVAIHPPRESVARFPEEWDDEPYRGQCGYLPHPRPRAGYAAMVSDLDSYVGRVVQSLENAGVAERTLVIFTSDNGTTHPRRDDTHFHVGGVDGEFFNSTAGLRGYKGSVYEGGIRVPMIVRLPGRVEAGALSDAPSYFPDWFPTLCDAAKLERPAELDGESLWPVLTGEAAPERRSPMVWVFPEYGGQVAVRIGDLKVVRQGLQTKTPGSWEVYDLRTDPTEAHDVAAQHGEVIERVKEVLRQELSENEIFPISIPGVAESAAAL